MLLASYDKIKFSVLDYQIKGSIIRASVNENKFSVSQVIEKAKQCPPRNIIKRKLRRKVAESLSTKWSLRRLS